MLSTATDNSVQRVAIRGRRRRNQQARQYKEKPTTVITYNKKMGAVDRQDQVIYIHVVHHMLHIYYT